jgi:hypothetical protein
MTEKTGTKKNGTHTKMRRRPFFFLISLGWIYLLDLYLQSRFMASPWCTSLLRMKLSALSYRNPVIRQDLPTRRRESLTLTGQDLPVGDFSFFVWASRSHIIRGQPIQELTKFGSSACPLPGAVRTISLSLSLCLVPILTNWLAFLPLAMMVGYSFKSAV